MESVVLDSSANEKKPPGWDPHSLSFQAKKDLFENGELDTSLSPTDAQPATPRDADAPEGGSSNSQAVPEYAVASTQEQSQTSRPVLQFGPRDPSQDVMSKGKSSRSRAESGKFEGEDISVEELRAQWVLKSTGSESRSLPKENGAPEHDVAHRVSEGGGSDFERMSEASAPISVDMASVTSGHSTYRDCAGLTQEVTTTCVAALLRESRSSRPSLASSTFEEPTYTMQDVQKEVLGLFSEDSSRPEAVDADAFVSEAASEQREPGCRSGEFNSFANPPQPGSSAFEIFEDVDIDQQQAADNGVDSHDDGTSGCPVWGDDEFNAAMS